MNHHSEHSEISAQEYWQKAQLKFPKGFAPNLLCDVFVEEVEGWQIPFTSALNEDQSYVLTPFNAYYHYALEEVHKIDSLMIRWIAFLIIQFTRPFLYFGKFHKTIYANNWLFSTIIYGGKWEKKSHYIPWIRQLAISKFSTEPIAFRSLNKHWNPQLMKSLESDGWLLVPIRQVWLMDTEDDSICQKHNVKRDLKLLENTSFRLIENHEFKETDFQRVAELYTMLYIEKYSKNNPQYTSEYLKYTWKTGLLTFFGFVDQEGVIQGVGGRYQVDRTSSGPILGYNTQLDVKLGLYRLLLIYPYKIAYENKYRLHRSSGASKFKKGRGAKPHIEYSAIYLKHLAWYRSVVWMLVARILKTFVVPYMQKHEM